MGAPTVFSWRSLKIINFFAYPSVNSVTWYIEMIILKWIKVYNYDLGL